MQNVVRVIDSLHKTSIPDAQVTCSAVVESPEARVAGKGATERAGEVSSNQNQKQI